MLTGMLQADADPKNVVRVPWTVAEPEAGELESPTLPDPRRSPAAATAPLVLPLVLPCPMFPFLPSKEDLAADQSGEMHMQSNLSVQQRPLSKATEVVLSL